ncbi:MAG: mechanosensitive ion channel protein MscS [Gammaproteobacteria bacterium]|nr:mechanosensitive ion channel protein MscS [Gammaproteobacteria bacterium]
MQADPISLPRLFRELLTPDGLNELLVALVAVAVAYICGRLMRRAAERLNSGPNPPAGWQWRLIEAGVIAAPYAIAVLLVALAREAAAAWGMTDLVLVVALRLVAALGAVRLAVYAVRLLLGDGSWLAAHEGRVTLFVWLALGLEVLGIFDWLERSLDQVDLLPGKSVFSLWDLLKGLVVVTLFVLTMTLLARGIERRVMAIESLAPATRIGISKSAYFLLIGLGVLLGINSAGVDLTALTVLTGAIVFALGFGIRDITSNFVSGFVLLMDKSIKPGDVISFHQHTGTTSDNFGWVQELRGRYVVVRDRDGVESLVPNQNLITNSVINWSYSDKRVRLRVPVMVSYDDDPELALELLVRATEGHPRILRDPAPVSRLISFENYGMKLEARFWIRDPMNGVNNVRSDVNRRIWRLFKDHGIKIPVAQQEVRVLEPGAVATRPAHLAGPDDGAARG